MWSPNYSLVSGLLKILVSYQAKFLNKQFFIETMALKRVQLSAELTTEKEWREFIRRPGLLVIDLYRDWAGPCSAMSTPLKTLKVIKFSVCLFPLQ